MTNTKVIRLGISTIILSICAGIFYKWSSIQEAKYQTYFDAGYRQAEAKYLADKIDALEKQRILNDKAKNKAVQLVKNDLSAIVAEKNKWSQKALKLAEINKGLNHELDKITNVDTCINRGFDYVRLWNDRARMFREASAVIGD